MGIGVQEPVHHHHAQVYRGQPFHQQARRRASPPHAVSQAIDADALHVLHHHHVPGGHVVEDARRPDGAVPGEGAPEAPGVLGFHPQIHLFPHLHREFANHVGQRPHVVVGEQHVQPEDDPERGIHVQRDPLFHVRTEHLHRHVASVEPGPVHLSEAGCRHGLAVEALEQIREPAAELLLDHAHDRVRGSGRHLVAERACGRQIGLRKDVGARGEHLPQLDEGRSEGSDGPDQPGGAALVVSRPSARRASDHDPASAVAQERDQERQQTKQDPRKSCDAPHGGVVASSSQRERDGMPLRPRAPAPADEGTGPGRNPRTWRHPVLQSWPQPAGFVYPGGCTGITEPDSGKPSGTGRRPSRWTSPRLRRILVPARATTRTLFESQGRADCGLRRLLDAAIDRLHLVADESGRVFLNCSRRFLETMNAKAERIRFRYPTRLDAAGRRCSPCAGLCRRLWQRGRRRGSHRPRSGAGGARTRVRRNPDRARAAGGARAGGRSAGADAAGG